MIQDNPIQLLYVDLFCGFGGTTYGVEMARDEQGRKIAKVIACVNHDANAINSHYLNHPGVKHFTEDIRTLEMKPLVQIVKYARQKYPNAKLVLWASLECTHFSIARGGLPRDADSRTLAEHLDRYIHALSPDYIKIENVKEFRSWGQLDENGKPLSREKGKHYLRWKKSICQLGYQVKEELLNSANYGACQSRLRLFMIFGKKGLPISFPEATHCKEPKSIGLFESPLKKWVAVKTVLDLEDEGMSIFPSKGKRKKHLSEKTLERIYAGLIKYVAGGEKHFIQKYFSGSPQSKVKSIDDVCGTITTIDHHSLVTCNTNDSIKGNHFLTEYYGKGRAISIEEPIGTITTKGRHGLIHTKHFIDRQFSEKENHHSIEVPSGTLTTVNKSSLVSIKENQFLLNPQYTSKGRSLEKPCFTLIARMDKSPPSLVSVTSGENENLEIKLEDLPVLKRIKIFMSIYNIEDIKMRMLNLKELLQIQGFPPHYKMVGTKAERCKYIGNAVHTQMSKVLCECIVMNLKKIQ